MSDHEGEGLDLERWEEVSVAGTSVYSYAVSEVHNQGVTRGNNFHPPSGPRAGPQGRSPAVQRQNGHVQARDQLVRFGQPRKAPVQPRQQQLRPPIYKNTARLQAEKGQPPSAQHQLITPAWRNLMTMALRVDRAAQPHPKEVLRQIMSRTDTYIKEPEDNNQVLYIWGEPEQVVEAKAQIAQLEQDIRDSATVVKPVRFGKNRALDGRAEHREDRQNQQKLMKTLMQEVDIAYAIEAALLWPNDLDIGEFERENLEVIDKLRDRYDCRITFAESNTEHIMIATQNQAEAMDIMTRMMNLIKETISQRNQLVTINMVQIPKFDIYRDRVGLLDLDPKTQSYLPTLHGEKANTETQLEKDRQQVMIVNRKKTKKTIDTTIKKFRVSQQHVRMRVVFGELGFTRFQKPPPPAETYTFEDFFSMVTKGRTELKLNGLPVRQGEIMDLANTLDRMDAFSGCTESYSAFFDFPGTTHDSTLRLETTFMPSEDDPSETSTEGKRWLEISKAVSRLQVSHLNFDRPDYQITLDAFPLGIDKLPRTQMIAFQAGVEMARPNNGINSLPRRRVKHPAGRGLQSVSEIITLHWHFKKTDGVFELRRKDLYDLRPGRESGSPAETRWHALYYYPHWDNLMSEFAGIRPGEDVSWAKSVATFFPEGGDPDSALPLGFKNFMGEVEEIQDLLAEAIRRVAKGKVSPLQVETEDAYTA